MRCRLYLLVAAVSLCSLAGADDRQPVPDEATQQKTDALVQEVFAEEIKKATKPDDKLTLSKRLIEESQKD